MSNLTYSSTELRELASAAIEKGDFETAVALAENAEDTAQVEAQEQQSKE